MKRKFTVRPVLASKAFWSTAMDAGSIQTMKAEISKAHDAGSCFADAEDYIDELYSLGKIDDSAHIKLTSYAYDLYMGIKASQERGTVNTYRNRRNPNKYIEVKKENDGHSSARQYMEWDTPEGKVRNYTGARDAKKGRYHRATQKTINSMLEDYYKIIDDELADCRDQTGLTNEEIAEEYGWTIDQLAESMDQTGLSVNDLLGCNE